MHIVPTDSFIPRIIVDVLNKHRKRKKKEQINTFSGFETSESPFFKYIQRRKIFKRSRYFAILSVFMRK